MTREGNPTRRAALTRGAGTQNADELVRLTAYVTDLRKRHDEVKQLVARKEAALQTRVDSVKVRALPPHVPRARRAALTRLRRARALAPRIWSWTR